MKDIYIRSLSTPSVLKNGTPVVFQRNKSLVLIIYLYIAGKNFYRDELTEFFWPHLISEKARANLRTVLSECRSILGDDIFLTDNQIIALNTANINSDFSEFLKLRESNNTEDLKKAEDLYEGNFLKGLAIHKSLEFDDWQFQVQQQLDVYYRDLLEKLINASSRKNDTSSEIHYLLKAVSVNPYNEEYYYKLIKLYSETGEYNSARHEYNNLKKLLNEDGLGQPEEKIQKTMRLIEKQQKESAHMKRETMTEKRYGNKKIIFIFLLITAAVTASTIILVNHRNQPYIPSSDPASIAVLPFNFMCDDENAEIFAECFTIEMINSLAEEYYMDLKPVQAVMIYRESILTVKEIADELEVDYIIDGSAMSYDECIRFSVQLIDTKQNSCIWTGSYNCSIDNSLKTELKVIQYLKTNIVKQLSSGI